MNKKRSKIINSPKYKDSPKVIHINHERSESSEAR